MFYRNEIRTTQTRSRTTLRPDPAGHEDGMGVSLGGVVSRPPSGLQSEMGKSPWSVTSRGTAAGPGPAQTGTDQLSRAS